MTRRSRPAPAKCDGCGTDVLPAWMHTARIDGRAVRVCLSCAAILKRLGITVTDQTGAAS